MSGSASTQQMKSWRSAPWSTLSSATEVGALADEHYRSRSDFGIGAAVKSPEVTKPYNRLEVRLSAGQGLWWAARDEPDIEGHRPHWPLVLATAVGRGLVRTARLAERRAALDPDGTVDSLPLSAWSVHPVAAAVLKSRMPVLVELLRDQTSDGYILLDDDDPACDPVRQIELLVRDGIVTIHFATLVDKRGDPVVGIRSDRGRPVALLPDYGLDTFATALPGLAPDRLVDLFGADPRSSLAPITHAEIIGRRSQQLRVQFDDVLVPLDPSHPGGEAWRPTRAVDPWPLGRIDREFAKALFETAREATAAERASRKREEARLRMLKHAARAKYAPLNCGRRPAGTVAEHSTL